MQHIYYSYLYSSFSVIVCNLLFVFTALFVKFSDISPLLIHFMEAFHLTAGAIESYLNGNPPNQTFVQVINIKKIPNSSATSTSLDKYRLQISDSIHYQPCLLVSSLTEKVINGEIDRYCIIKIEEMIPTNIQGRRILLIKGLTVCRMGDSISQVIGNPTSLELKKVS